MTRRSRRCAPRRRRTGTNDTAGARRIARGVRRRPRRRPGRARSRTSSPAIPDADTSLRIALAAIDAGADLLEVGLPYSDPLADGATLQRASQRRARGRRDARGQPPR